MSKLVYPAASQNNFVHSCSNLDALTELNVKGRSRDNNMGASQGRDTMVPSSCACDCQDERKPPRLSRTIFHFSQRKEERKLTKPSGFRLYSRSERDQESPVRRGVGRIEVTQTLCDPVYDSDTPLLKNLGPSKSGHGRADQVQSEIVDVAFITS